jgi:hypothetical protein
MHGDTLKTVANAIKGRDDPETVPDVQGMDGIPADDLAEFTARMTGNPLQSSTVGRPVIPPWNAATAPMQQPAKRAKIETPLDSQTIAAQLADFQRKKEKEELAQFIASGVSYPPGTRTQPAFFIIRLNPPGQGPWAAKNWTQLYPASERPRLVPPRPWPHADGKSASHSSKNSAQSPQSSSNEPLLSPKLAVKCVSSPPSA